MKIFVVTDTKYPANDAVTTRTLLLSKIFAELGHDVRVYSRTEKQDGLYEGIPYCSLRGSGSSAIKKIYNYYCYFERSFLKIVKEHKPDVIAFHNIPTGLLKKLIRLKDKYHFRLINDCVEWYSKEQDKTTVMSLFSYYTRDYHMRKILPGNVEIIAISQYLKSYFESNGTHCTYLPSVCDSQKDSVQKNGAAKKVRIVYAGSPGHKDLFEPIVKAIRKMTEQERTGLELEIIGATKTQIADNANCSVSELDELGESIRFLPRMGRTDVLTRLEAADFTILIRPEHLRYAKAGFPTKVPESLSTGTPVICNLTSDLAMYLQDGYNAIIADGSGEESVYVALKRAMMLTEDQRNEMYRNACLTAKNRFDYRLYKENIAAFLNTGDEN